MLILRPTVIHKTLHYSTVDTNTAPGCNVGGALSPPFGYDQNVSVVPHESQFNENSIKR